MLEKVLVNKLSNIIDIAVDVAIDTNGTSRWGNDKRRVVFYSQVEGFNPVFVNRTLANKIKRKLWNLLDCFFGGKEGLIGHNIAYIEEKIGDFSLTRRLFALCYYLGIWRINAPFIPKNMSKVISRSFFQSIKIINVNPA